MRLLPVALQVLVVHVETAVDLDVFLFPVRRLVGVELVEVANQLGLLGAGLQELDSEVAHDRTSYSGKIDGIGISISERTARFAGAIVYKSRGQCHR
ncbi:hypothetical protein D3C76_1344690 [compost metagenome]